MPRFARQQVRLAVPAEPSPGKGTSRGPVSARSDPRFRPVTDSHVDPPRPVVHHLPGGFPGQPSVNLVGGYRVLLRPWGRRQRRRQDALPLAHRGLGVAPLAVEFEQGQGGQAQGADVGDQVEVPGEELAGLDLDHQNHPPDAGPARRLVAQLVAPEPLLPTRTVQVPVEVRLGQLVQSRVRGLPRDVADTFLLQGQEQLVVRKASIHADRDPLADLGLHPGDLVQDERDGVGRGVQRARAQHHPEEVALPAQRGDQRMIDVGVVVPIVLAAGLLAEHLDGQGVDVQRFVVQAVSLVGRPDPLTGCVQQRVVQHPAVSLAAQPRQRPGQRRLRGQAFR